MDTFLRTRPALPPVLRDSLSVQILDIAEQIQAICLARGQDVCLSPEQASALEGIRRELEAIDAHQEMNQQISLLLREYQEELTAALFASYTPALDTDWQRFCVSFRAFGERVDATRATVDALTVRHLALTQDVLAHLQREGRA